MVYRTKRAWRVIWSGKKRREAFKVGWDSHLDVVTLAARSPQRRIVALLTGVNHWGLHLRPMHVDAELVVARRFEKPVSPSRLRVHPNSGQIWRHWAEGRRLSQLLKRLSQFRDGRKPLALGTAGSITSLKLPSRDIKTPKTWARTSEVSQAPSLVMTSDWLGSKTRSPGNDTGRCPVLDGDMGGGHLLSRTWNSAFLPAGGGVSGSNRTGDHSNLWCEPRTEILHSSRHFSMHTPSARIRGGRCAPELWPTQLRLRRLHFAVELALHRNVCVKTPAQRTQLQRELTLMVHVLLALTLVTKG